MSIKEDNVLLSNFKDIPISELAHMEDEEFKETYIKQLNIGEAKSLKNLLNIMWRNMTTVMQETQDKINKCRYGSSPERDKLYELLENATFSAMTMELKVIALGEYIESLARQSI